MARGARSPCCARFPSRAATAASGCPASPRSEGASTGASEGAAPAHARATALPTTTPGAAAAVRAASAGGATATAFSPREDGARVSARTRAPVARRPSAGVVSAADPSSEVATDRRAFRTGVQGAAGRGRDAGAPPPTGTAADLAASRGAGICATYVGNEAGQGRDATGAGERVVCSRGSARTAAAPMATT